ncbi:MAG: hypothetical protein KGM44_09695, partial [bacterium]|nr:hypothetical protein [bacterium]
MRAIVLSAILLLTIRVGAFAVDAPPFAVLQIQTSHGLRSATVQVAPGPRGIITVVPGATFGSVTVMRIDEDGVVLSDGIKVGIDRD